MHDQATPTLTTQNEGLAISLTIPQTQAQLENQGYTYNQANFTYNQTGVAYGGIYNTNEDSVPLLDTASFIQPTMAIYFDGGNISLTIPKTQAQLVNQGYTYNQSGFTYNQAGVQYGGIYNTNTDVVPLELGFVDIYSPFVPPPIFTNIPLGPGFFIFITQ